MKSRTRILLLAMIVVGLAVLGVQAALATTPNDVQYGTTPSTTTTPSTPSTTTTSGVAGTSKPLKPPKAPAPVAVKQAGGTLPFTGLDLAVLAAAGGLVIVGGLGLRKLGAKNNSD